MKDSQKFYEEIAEYDTQAASPIKKNDNSTDKKFDLNKTQYTTQAQTAFHSKKMSKTEEQIYSHDLISKIMKKRQNNSVSHTVGQFDPQIQLYSKPLNPEDYGMLQFSDQKQMYQSQYTKKIVDIHKKLNRGKTLSQRVNNRKQDSQNSGLFKSKRPSSAQPNKSQNTHKKISVSGLVSYNFNSVNARKTLGYDFQRDEDKLDFIMKKIHLKNKCCSHRQHSIIQKKKQLKAQKQKQIKQAIFSDFQTQTRRFINNLHEQISDQKIVYGVKWSKILCIKSFMQQQKIPYSQAQLIVDQIQQKKKEQKRKIEVKKLKQNDQALLQNRRKVLTKTRLMVKQLYFVD